MKKKSVDIFKKKSGIMLDIGCGASKNKGFIGIDYHQYGDVDIVWNIEKTPWKVNGKIFPKESVVLASSSHVLEHIDPHGGVFINVMNEIWRVLQPNSQFAFVTPYAGSHGYFQDPTHCNPINETTMGYFDPEHPSGLYQFYEPAPWNIEMLTYHKEGNIECILRKRPDDKSYHADGKIHYV